MRVNWNLVLVLAGGFCFPNSESKILRDSPLSGETRNLNQFLMNNALLDKNDIFSERYVFNKQMKKSYHQLDQILSEAVFKQLDEELQAGRVEKYKAFANQATAFSSQFQGCSNDSRPSSDSEKIKTYKLNLDLKPEERWLEVINDKKYEISELAKFFEEKFGTKFMSVVDKYIAWLHQTLPQEYFLELNGIARETGLSIGRVTLYNVFYEFFSVCTSIVIESEDGHMYHGRNLDFGVFMGWDPKNHTWFITELLRPLIIKLDFIKNGQLLYTALTYAGFTGVLTGVKKSKFSMSINERFIMDGGYVGLAEWILGRRDISWLGLLTREVMESADTYQQAVMMVTTTCLVAPVYFIMAGNSSKQGCIVTRGREDFDIWQLGSRYPNQSGKWFLVETNTDHWQEPAFFDERRRHAVECTDQLGRQQPLDTLYRVLSTRPVLNKETTLTALMDVSTGLLQVWARECGNPCWPF